MLSLPRTAMAAHSPPAPHAARSTRLRLSASQCTSSQRAGGTVATSAANNVAAAATAARTTPSPAGPEVCRDCHMAAKAASPSAGTTSAIAS